MAHYVFQRNNGYGDFDYIASFETMAITDYKEFAAQVDECFLPLLDMECLASYGFYAVSLTSLCLRIQPRLMFMPRTPCFRPPMPSRAPRARGAAPAPRPIGARPAPHGRWIEPARPSQVNIPAPAPMPAPERRGSGRGIPAPINNGGRGASAPINNGGRNALPAQPKGGRAIPAPAGNALPTQTGNGRNAAPAGLPKPPKGGRFGR